MQNASYWIDKLQLTAHVEGGAFRETYRSDMMVPRDILTLQHNGDRNVATSIYFLLQHGEFSALHRIASDEMWHHYEGAILHIYEINTSGELIIHLLGKDIDNGAQPQVLVPAGSWFGSRVEQEGAYTLCGCTVAPGFDFEDFELAEREPLLQQYPQYSDVITSLTRV